MKKVSTISGFIFIVFLVFLFSCKKQGTKRTSGQLPDNRGTFVGKYLPFYFGSKWYYTMRKVDKGQVLATYKQVWRYDSLEDVIHIYSQANLISWIYCARADDHHFIAGGGQNFLDDEYLDSTEGKAFVTEQDSNYAHYTYGGLVQVNTKFGLVPCIKNAGVSGKTMNAYWFRYFGFGYGMVKEEEYVINSIGDTTYHYITELDSCFINK